MFSRIAGLLSKFGLRKRVFSCENMNSIELIDKETCEYSSLGVHAVR